MQIPTSNGHSSIDFHVPNIPSLPQQNGLDRSENHPVMQDYAGFPSAYGLDPRIRNATYPPQLSSAVVPSRAPFLQGFTDASSYALPTYGGHPATTGSSYMYPTSQAQTPFPNAMFGQQHQPAPQSMSMPSPNLPLAMHSLQPMQSMQPMQTMQTMHLPEAPQQTFSPHALRQVSGTPQLNDMPTRKRKRAICDTPGEQARSSHRMSIRTFLLNPADERVRALSPPPLYPNHMENPGNHASGTDLSSENVVTKGIVPEALAARYYSRYV